MTSKHEFAFYSSGLTETLEKSQKNQGLRLTDEVLVRRIGQVLRLQVEEHCILFDQSHHAQVVVKSITKKYIDVTVQRIRLNTIFEPSITVLLPLLKREALEEALYSCVELGATEIQLVLTEKVQRGWGGAKEAQRLENVMIAAAEQSKNFAFPKLNEPAPLLQALHALPSTTLKVCAAVNGQPLFSCMEMMKQHTQSLVLLIGPEGDLVQQEYQYLYDHQWTMCALTPTVLRAQQALAVVLGALRST